MHNYQNKKITEIATMFGINVTVGKKEEDTFIPNFSDTKFLNDLNMKTLRIQTHACQDLWNVQTIFS